MTDPSLCPTCGKPLAPNAPRGLCPECLMQAALSGTETNDSDSPPAAAPPPVEEIARLFPQLEVLELLGRGGMGAVYKARQAQLDRLVALKILLRQRQDGAPDSAFAERFGREARALARLNHPNIVAVYDYGQAGGYAFLLMEYVDGLTLRQLLQRGRLAPEEALGIVPQVCEALQFAHQQGVVHRDIKPENILLDKQGRVKIGDFGIAKIAGPAAPTGLTQDQQVIGTPHYMAPEQVEKPQAVDHRADIYSLGVVFYEMLTGELPLGKFAPPSSKSWADARLDQVVLHALEKEPDRRYQQASEVKTDVETIAATPGEARVTTARTPRPQPTAAQAGKGPSSWKTVLLAGGFALAAALIFIGLAALFLGAEKTPLTRGTASLSATNALWALLNEDQRLVVQWTDREYYYLDDRRSFDGWPAPERAQLERRSIDALRGPRTSEYFEAINTLAALRSTNALPTLRNLACDPINKLLRAEVSNRPRWMATRALGRIGDKSVVPDLIHVLYHYNPNVRWWAQISLVQLSGRNFGSDWKAWGDWWNAQHGQPPFQPETVCWRPGQAEAGQLARALAEGDRKFLGGLRKRFLASPSPAIQAEATADSLPDAREPNQNKPKENHRTMTDSNTSSSLGGLVFVVIALLIALGLYLFFCFCCKRICQKAGREPGALIWIPILQLIPLLQAAGMATWMFLLFLIPLVNLVLGVMMWAKICAALGKSPWLVLLMFVPLVNLVFIPYLAFAEGKPGNATPASTPAV